MLQKQHPTPEHNFANLGDQKTPANQILNFEKKKNILLCREVAV